MHSLVIPVLNEANIVPTLYERVSAALDQCGEDYEVIVVDDGSTDETPKLIAGIHERDERWKLIRLSRNFGHQLAISAGIQHASGDAVAIMDGDLQDPPEFLGRMFAKWQEGYEVVYAVRRKRKEGILKRAAYKLFYRLLSRLASVEIPLDAGDFCVMDRAVVDVLRSMPERTRFVRGLRSWAGYRQIGIEYERDARHSGEPKYTLRKLIGLATNGIISLSSRPLRIASWMGVGLCATSVVLVLALLAWWLSGQQVFGVHPSNSVGWTSIMSMLLFLSGLQMLMIGIVGEYLARVFDEVKQRPAWIISQACGFDAAGETFREVPGTRNFPRLHATLPAPPSARRTRPASDSTTQPLPLDPHAVPSPEGAEYR